MKEDKTHQEINQELIGLGAHRLVELRDSAEFRLPKDLKNSVHDVVLTQIDEEEFQIPSNFFEDSQREFLNQLPEEKAPTKVFKVTPWTLSLAAAAVLALVFLLPGSGTEEECISFDCLLAQTELGISDYELLYAEGGDLSELIEADALFIDITEEEAMDYLMESDFETEELW